MQGLNISSLLYSINQIDLYVYKYTLIEHSAMQAGADYQESCSEGASGGCRGGCGWSETTGQS